MDIKQRKLELQAQKKALDAEMDKLVRLESGDSSPSYFLLDNDFSLLEGGEPNQFVKTLDNKWELYVDLTPPTSETSWQATITVFDEDGYTKHEEDTDDVETALKKLVFNTYKCTVTFQTHLCVSENLFFEPGTNKKLSKWAIEYLTGDIETALREPNAYEDQLSFKSRQTETMKVINE